MFISLSNILRRSSNPAFQESCQTQLKVSGFRSYMVRKLNLEITQTLEKAMFASLADSENRLSSYLESPSSLDTDKCQHALPDGDETVFIHAMEQIYWLAMKKRKFKVIAPPADDFQVLTLQKSISTPQDWLQDADDSFCDQQSSFVGFVEEPHSGASDDHEEGGCLNAQVCSLDRPSRVQIAKYRSNLDLNTCLGQYGGIPDDRGDMIFASLADDLFASDSDHLDTQLGNDQFLRIPGPWSFPSDFPPILGSFPADRDPDYMSLNVAQSLENGATKSTLSFQT